MDLRSGLDEVLQVSAEQEVAEVDELAVVLILDYQQVSQLCVHMRLSILKHTINNLNKGRQ